METSRKRWRMEERKRRRKMSDWKRNSLKRRKRKRKKKKKKKSGMHCMCVHLNHVYPIYQLVVERKLIPVGV